MDPALASARTSVTSGRDLWPCRTVRSAAKLASWTPRPSLRYSAKHRSAPAWRPILAPASRRSAGSSISRRIALRLGLPGEQDRTIQTLEAGDVFGWSTLLPSAIATSTGITLAPSRAILFEGSSLRTAIAIDSELATAIYHRLFASVARRLEPNRTV